MSVANRDWEGIKNLPTKLKSTIIIVFRLDNSFLRCMLWLKRGADNRCAIFFEPKHSQKDSVLNEERAASGNVPERIRGDEIMAQIIFNGKAAEFAPDDTLASFLKSRNIAAKNLIVGWNGKILTESDLLESFTLQDGDTVNLFSMVGGG